MRKKPAASVVIVTSRPRGLRRAMGLLALGSLALSAWYLGQSGTPAWALIAVGVAWLFALWLADRAWRQLPHGRWHGHGQSGWRWQAAHADVATLHDQTTHRLRVVWDGQRHLLLASNTSALTWCWVSEGQQTHDWGAVRRALHAKPRDGRPDHPATGAAV